MSPAAALEQNKKVENYKSQFFIDDSPTQCDQIRNLTITTSM